MNRRGPLPLRLLRHRRGAVLAFVAVYGFGFSAFLLVDALVRLSGEDVSLKSRELLEGDLRIRYRKTRSLCGGSGVRYQRNEG